MNTENSMDSLIEDVQKWAFDKGLIKEENCKSQMIKVVEEVGEVASALLKNNHEELVDGIGDSFVTLIILATQKGLEPKDCLQAAYDVIKNRKGKMVGETFLKSEDL